MSYFNASKETTLHNLQSVFENTEVGHLLLDPELRVVTFNRAMETGYGRSIVTGLKIDQPLTGELLAVQQGNFEEMITALQQSDEPVELEVSHECDAQTRHYTVTIVPIYAANRDLLGYCVSAVDITRRKVMEIERQQMIHDLLSRNKDLEQFAYMVSHNIRSPLAQILGLANVLSYDLAENDRRTAVDAIVTAAIQLDKALSDTGELVSKKRPGTGRKTRVLLQDMLNETIADLSADIKRSGAVITSDFPVVQEVMAIPSYLRSIFLNAISNSIRYAKPGTVPEISIRSGTEDEFSTLTFSDKGLGLDLERSESKLFGLYQRFHPQVEGKGMGLFMIKTQTEIMNGTVQVLSAPGDGFKLIIRLPK